MLSLLGIIAFVAAFFWFHNRIGKLEKLAEKHELKEKPVREVAPQASHIPLQRAEEAIEEAGTERKEAVVVSNDESWAIERLFIWLKEDWLLKLGATLLLIGFGWLATFAFVNNWIGPMGRITLGLVAGVLILVLGWWRLRSYVYQGSTFLVLGSSVILLTTFAARELYDFLVPT